MTETTKSALDRLNERMAAAREARGVYEEHERRMRFDGIEVEVTREYMNHRLWRVVTDYTIDGRTVRVIDWLTKSSYGRNNAELIQLGTDRPTRTYKHVESAKAKAIELLLG